jgi:glycerophosphoryl diester phosphodiesterase
MRISSIIVASALLGTGLLPNAPAEATMIGSCEVAAHRGNTNVSAYTATENGMKAFQRSVALSVDWIETDIASTSDDQPMLMHDSTVDRTTNGTGYLRSKTAAQARLLKLDDGSKIPYLTELMGLAQANGTKLLLELSIPGGTAWWTRVTQAVMPYADHIVLQSMHQPTLDKAATYMPGVRRGLVYWKEIPIATAQKYGSIVIEKPVASDSYLAQLDGVAVYPYLISTTDDWNRLAGRVDALLTNKPATLLNWRTTTQACQT